MSDKKTYGENQRVVTIIENNIAHVILSRPDKMNALDHEMFEAIAMAGEDLFSQKNIRAVVLSGEGRGFCAGIDMQSLGALATPSGDDLTTRTYGDCNVFQRVAMVWRDLPMPVIGAIHGIAFGGGLQIALGPDIRFVHPETKLSVMEVKWGLSPDMAGTYLMRDLVRDDVLRDLTYSGRIFSGIEAKEYGFATHLSDNPVEDALNYAKQIAALSPSTMRTSKKLIGLAKTASRHEQLLAESVYQEMLMKSEDHREAVAAGMQKRPPNFK